MKLPHRFELIRPEFFFHLCFFLSQAWIDWIGVSHNPQPLSASISILFPGLPLHFSDINSAFEKGMETFFFFFFSRKLGISNRKDNMSLLFFDWCRRLAFRDAIQKFCPFPVSFFFFFLVAWRSSLFALKKILYMSFNSCGRNIMSYGRMKKCFAPDSGMQDSDLWESPHCREILWRPVLAVHGNFWATSGVSNFCISEQFLRTILL